MKNTLAYLTARGAQLPQGEQTRLQTISVVGGDRFVVRFDASTNQEVIWTIPNWPEVYQGNGNLYLQVDCAMATATSGSLILQSQVESITPGDPSDIEAVSQFDVVNVGPIVTVPPNSRSEFSVAILLTNKSAVIPGDHVRIKLIRDAASDTASGDLHVLGAVVYEDVPSLLVDVPIGIFEPNPTGGVHISIDLATRTGQIIKGAPVQTAPLTDWQDSTGFSVATVTPDGTFTGKVKRVVSDPYTCSPLVSVGDAVYVSGVDTVGQASAFQANTVPVIGFVLGKPSATACIVQYAGEFPMAGLSPGSVYFLDVTAGAITNDVSSFTTGNVYQRVGVARSSSSLVITVDPQIIVL